MYPTLISSIKLTVTLTFISVLNVVQAGEVEDKIISKVSDSYGGSLLRSATSIKISDFNKGPWPGESENPKIPEVWKINEELTIDFKNKRKSMLSWRVSRSAKDLDRFVFDGTKGRIYDVLNHKYVEESWITYDSIGLSLTRASDTMLAQALTDFKSTATYKGETHYRGLLHQKLSVQTKAPGKSTLYINKESGLISKVVRHNPRFGELTYVFSNHTKSNGIAFARDMNFFVGGQLRLVSVFRNVELNPALQGLFSEPEGYSNWGEIFETPEMSVIKVAENIYHVGKNGSFSIFVDTGDYFVSSGGKGGLKESFQALKESTGNKIPLKYVVISHHHSAQLGILDEAIELGAKIVTVKEHLATIKKAITKNISGEEFILIDKEASLGNNAVKIYDIATAHSDHYLLFYIPKEKIVFGEDHFATELKSGLPRVHKDMKIFGKKLDALGVEVDSFLNGYSIRQLSIEDFKTAIDAYKEVTCPAGYSICANG